MPLCAHCGEYVDVNGPPHGPCSGPHKSAGRAEVQEVDERVAAVIIDEIGSDPRKLAQEIVRLRRHLKQRANLPIHIWPGEPYTLAECVEMLRQWYAVLYKIQRAEVQEFTDHDTDGVPGGGFTRPMTRKEMVVRARDALDWRRFRRSTPRQGAEDA